MKSLRVLFIISIAALTLLCGCPDRKSVTTKINRDGSCSRSIGSFDPRDFKGIDSVLHNLPIPVDMSWNLETINDSTAVLRKDFTSVGALNASYARDESKLKMYKRNMELTKKFRWFHTVFHYRETYEGILTEIPLMNYMSKAEAETFKMDNQEDHPLFIGLDSKARKSLIDNIEERFGLWLHANMYSMIVDDIINVADSLKMLDKNSINNKALKDSVQYQIDKLEKQIITFDFSDDQLDLISLVNLMAHELDLDSIAKRNIGRIYNEDFFEERYEDKLFAGITDDYGNRLIMPGLLIDTNAESLKGDTLKWNVDLIKFIDSDYEMFAESKVTNYWAYVLSGLIILIAVIIPIIGKLRRNP